MTSWDQGDLWKNSQNQEISLITRRLGASAGQPFSVGIPTHIPACTTHACFWQGVQGRIQGVIQGGGGSRGKDPQTSKRGKKPYACVQKRRVLVLNSYQKPPPLPLSEILYPPLQCPIKSWLFIGQLHVVEPVWSTYIQCGEKRENLVEEGEQNQRPYIIETMHSYTLPL